MVAWILSGVSLSGQQLGDSRPLGATAQNGIPQYLKGAGFVERLNQPLPLNISFTDAMGNQIELGSYFHHKRPIAMALVYFKCLGLCPMVLHGMANAVLRKNQIRS